LYFCNLYFFFFFDSCSSSSLTPPQCTGYLCTRSPKWGYVLSAAVPSALFLFFVFMIFGVGAGQSPPPPGKNLCARPHRRGLVGPVLVQACKGRPWWPSCCPIRTRSSLCPTSSSQALSSPSSSSAGCVISCRITPALRLHTSSGLTLCTCRTSTPTCGQCGCSAPSSFAAVSRTSSRPCACG
jgi:hypothetical protein